MTTTTAPPPLTPLEPGQRWVMQINAMIPAVLGIASGFGAGTALYVQTGWSPLWVAVPVTLIALWFAMISPTRRFRAWGWALAGDELHVAHGVWTHVHTIVPFARVQHIDVAQGPIERRFGLARLIVHTAGTAHATVELPGIRRETAEEVRDLIREKVRAEPW